MLPISDESEEKDGRCILVRSSVQALGDVQEILVIGFAPGEKSLNASGLSGKIS
jgi:hypothetical protein